MLCIYIYIYIIYIYIYIIYIYIYIDSYMYQRHVCYWVYEEFFWGGGYGIVCSGLLDSFTVFLRVVIGPLQDLLNPKP